MIESLNNEKLKKWIKLKTKKYQEEFGLFLIEGDHLVEEAHKMKVLEEVIVLDGYTYDFDKVTIVSESVMKKITSLTTVPRIIGVAKFLDSSDIKGSVLLLDSIQDPGNMGTIIRSAVAFGIGTIIVGEGSVSVYNPKVIRSSEGMLFHVNIIRGNLKDYIECLKKDNYTIFGTAVENGENVKNLHFAKKCAIIIGNEGAGISPEIKKMCDKNLYIKMSDECESLNAGVAASIIMYELYK